MRRIHIALAVRDLEASIADYRVRLRSAPSVVVAGRYALWRTESVNLSITELPERTGALRHLGFEDEAAEVLSAEVDVNGIAWERFSRAAQDAEILAAFGEEGAR